MSKEAMKLALEALKSISEMVDYEGNGFKLEYEIKALEEALAKQEQGEPVACDFAQEVIGCFDAAESEGLSEALANTQDERLKDLIERRLMYALYAAQNYTKPQQRKPQFKDFIKWAGSEGYDSAHTCNSDTGKWIALNPMTADLWKAWKAAHGIKE